MNIKIVGVGKCGSRICYDFFAQVRDLPSAYQIRTAAQANTGRKLAALLQDKIGYTSLRRKARTAWEEFAGNALLRDEAVYAIVDSDLGNNEVVGEIEFLTDAKQVLFPGTTYRLAGTTGGCQFHIISERIANHWEFLPEQLWDPQRSEIFAFAFSSGGGTGGGAAAQLASRCRQRHESEGSNDVIHFMGIAILPTSDRQYFREEFERGIIPPMEDNEKYNSGRFFVSHYGNRLQDKNGNPMGFNSVWLVSNDLLRSAVVDESRSEQEPAARKALNNSGISLINSYVGLALCTLCNASSRGTNSFADFDPMEMNNSLPRTYVTGFGNIRREGNMGLESLLAHLSKLLHRTFANPNVVDGQLQGLSVLVDEDELKQVHAALPSTCQSVGEYRAAASKLKSVNRPRLFTSPERVIAILGQPQKRELNVEFHDLARAAVFSLYDNSAVSWYSFQHAGDIDFLLVFMVNPVVPAVVDSMFHYISQTWLKEGNGEELLPEAVLGDQNAIRELEKHLHTGDESSHLNETPLKSIHLNQQGAIPFGPEVVMSAIQKLSKMYTWKKKRSPTAP